MDIISIDVNTACLHEHDILIICDERKIVKISYTMKTIHVEFVNQGDESVIGAAELAPESLPDTFAVCTSVDVAKTWSVIRAEPVNKSEYLKSGRLRLFLDPIVTVPVGELLYSLPTISNEIGAGEGEAPPDETIFQIHEDDWRQIEFVSKAYEDQIALEFDDIQQVYQGRTPGGAFARVHVRKRIASPLIHTPVTLAGLERRLPAKHRYKAVGVRGSLGVFKGSFAWNIDDGIVLWGVNEERGGVNCLCLSLCGAIPRAGEISHALAKLCAEYNLYLVVWCQALKCTMPDEIRKLL
jgi:hypothetical protein